MIRLPRWAQLVLPVFLVLLPALVAVLWHIPVLVDGWRTMDRPYNGHPAPSECGPSRGSGSHYHYHFLLWTTRGANLTFDYGNTIYMVDIEGTEVRAVAKTNSDFHRSAYGFHADASPDHNRIVYSSCEFKTEREVYYSERAKYNYEIVLLDLHTGEQQRLTRNTRLEHYPVWSPDGSGIVYIGSPPNPRPLTAYSTRLYTMSAEGSQGQLVVPTVRALGQAGRGTRRRHRHVSAGVVAGRGTLGIHLECEKCPAASNFICTRSGKTDRS